MTPLEELLEEMLADGFDKSRIELEENPDGSDSDYKTIRTGCSQCNACNIQGIPCHELGCPNHRKAVRAERAAEMEEECDS